MRRQFHEGGPIESTENTLLKSCELDLKGSHDETRYFACAEQELHAKVNAYLSSCKSRKSASIVVLFCVMCSLEHW